MDGKRPHSPDCPGLPRWPGLAEAASGYAQGCSYQKIAETVSISPHTAHHRVSGAREHMETEYGTELPGAELRRHLIEVGCCQILAK